MKENLGRKIICDSYKTPHKKPVLEHGQLIAKTWIDVDCSGQSCGRLSSRIASILRGKEDHQYTPHGRFFGVNCLNYDKIVLTGDKQQKKVYYDKVSDHFGSLKPTKCGDILKRGANFLILRMVKGMLPRGVLKSNLHKFIRFNDTKGVNNE